MASFTPDATKHLHVLAQEWSNCTECELGTRRMSAKHGGNFVPGEGTKGRVMVIGGGPDKDDDNTGRPFSGEAGGLLKRVIKAAGLEGHCYFTNTVGCRSCSQKYDGEGQPQFWQGGQPAIFDHDPFGAHFEACRPRLYEEIYIVDPLVIVTLGGVATEVVTRKKVSVQASSGAPLTAQIPGAGFTPRLTEKKQQWYRKVRGAWVLPVDKNYVEYLCVPTMAPGAVLRSDQDKRGDAPLSQFVKAFEIVRNIYFKYMEEVGTPEGY